jgi:hypothetical protein
MEVPRIEVDGGLLEPGNAEAISSVWHKINKYLIYAEK